MDAIKEQVKLLANEFGKSRTSLLPILQKMVDQEHFLSEEAMVSIAEELDLSAAEVYGTASFYSFLEHPYAGKYIIRICKTITCSMKGKNQLLMAIQDMLKVKLGETTADGLFTLLETNCLGMCHKGPALLINHQLYTEVTPERVREILSEYLQK